MLQIIGFVLTIVVIAVQTYAGHIHNKYLGAVIPVLFTGAVLYLIFFKQMALNFHNLLMPIVGLAAFIGLYNFAGIKNKK